MEIKNTVTEMEKAFDGLISEPDNCGKNQSAGRHIHEHFQD